MSPAAATAVTLTHRRIALRPSRPGAADEGGDFQGLRDYQPGDPPRRIHWTGVAKGQGVAVKRFGRDTGSDPAASGRRYGLRLPDRTLPPDAGPAHRRRCLEALALCPY